MPKTLSLIDRYARGESVRALADESGVSVTNLLNTLTCSPQLQAHPDQDRQPMTRAELDDFIPQWSAEHPQVHRMKAVTLVPHTPADRDYLLDLFEQHPTQAMVRDYRLAAELRSGRTLESIAGDEGLTRERVRQLIRLHEPAIDGLQIRRVLKQQQDRERKDHLLAQARQILTGESFMEASQLAAHLQCSPTELSWLMTQDLPARVSRVQTWQEQRYSDKDIVQALREVAPRVGKPVMSREDYDEYRDKTHPSGVLMTQRLGWITALQKAGLAFNQARRTYDDRRSDEQMLSDLRRFLREQPRGNSSDYEAWSKQQTGALSLSSVQHRSGSWAKAVKLALDAEE